MPFCANCGKQFFNGAKFCPECGTPVSGTQSQNTGQRNQEYVGEIKQCPNCGGTISAFEAICHSCGHELRNAKASNAVQALSDAIAKIEATRSSKTSASSAHEVPYKNKRASKSDTTQSIKEMRELYLDPTDRSIANVIQNFAIPNNKEDILEFFILAANSLDASALYHTRGYETSESVIARAWNSKFEQAYQKAKLAFGNSADFNTVQEIYAMKRAELKRKKLRQFVFCAMLVALPVLLVALSGLAIGIPHHIEEKQHNAKVEELEKVVAEIQECISNQDYDTAFIKANTLYMDDGYSSESTKQWDKIREDLIDMIETKSGISYTSRTSSSDEKDMSTSNSLTENVNETKEAFRKGVDSLEDFLNDPFAGIFE